MTRTPVQKAINQLISELCRTCYIKENQNGFVR